MKEKQGISLIVLVITIIVMVILAGAIVLTLNNSGIIAKAEDAVKQTNIATIREVTQMAWAEAYVDGARSQSELEQAITAALTENKITAEMYKGYTLQVTESGVELVETVQDETEEEGVGNDGENVETFSIFIYDEFGYGPWEFKIPSGQEDMTWRELIADGTFNSNCVTCDRVNSKIIVVNNEDDRLNFNPGDDCGNCDSYNWLMLYTESGEEVLADNVIIPNGQYMFYTT